jgi:alpha-L-fucosidase 2
MGTMFVYFNNYLVSDPKYNGKRGEGYERILDLEKAIVTTKRKMLGVEVKGEYFISAPDQVFVYKIKASEPVLDVHINFMRRPCDMTGMPVEDGIIHTPGQAGPDGVKFDSFFSAKTDGKMETIGDHIGFSEASEITIYFTASTNFYEEDPKAVALAQLKAAMSIDYEELKARHVAEHSALFNRSNIKLTDKQDDRSTV